VPGPFYFAWAGGAIEEQITLATNGTTHGAGFETSTLIGTLAAGAQQLTDIASTAGLEIGVFHHLGGNGPIDAYFIFDDSVLSGLPGSINLSAAAGDAILSGQFTATKAATIGTVIGTVSQGSSSVTLDAGGLPAGTYGIFGTVIGETDIPLGTIDGTTITTGGGILTIGGAFLDYAGGGIGNLYIYAATPHTTTVVGDLGELEGVTTYTVAAQPVRATASGQFPLTITGFPVSDPAVVTGIPSGALMSLTPGLIYNVTGNGIPVGATFIAPSSGTSITLDLPATASDINAILTITGPRTPNAPFDVSVHNRFDEDVVSLEIAQEEGGLATLTVSIKNPNVGLLATGRNLWCWLSWDRNWTPAGGTPDIQPLFNGRLIGVPRLQAGELVELQFLARPDDLNAQKTALAASLQVLPYYDPVWLAGGSNLDTVLESYSALWHIDRATLQLTISDVLEGEAGIVDIGEDVSIYDNFSLSYGPPPLIATTVTGTVAWQQQAEGVIDITDQIVGAFHHAGSYWTRGFERTPYSEGGGGLIQVLTGDGLKSDWPRPGTAVGSGWSLSTGTDPSGTPLCYIYEALWFQPTFYKVTYEGHGAAQVPLGSTLDQANLAVYFNPVATFTIDFPLNVYKIRMNLQYKADRKRTETVTAVMMGGLQSTLSDSAEQDREAISLSSEFVGQNVDLDGSIPIGNVAYRSYFQTARGAASFEYLLLSARAKMRARARAVDVTFAVPWRTALDIGLRHSVRLTDRRLPGGTATGKVKSYKLTCSDAGTMLGEFTLGCSIGTGDGIAPQVGTPVYVDAGYVNSGYEVMAGAQVPAGVDDDLAYQALDNFAIIDDNLDLTRLTATQAVINCTVLNGLTVQLPMLSSFQGSTGPGNGDPRTAMANTSTSVTLNLQPLQGAEFHADFFPAVTPLRLPKTIDLAAPAPGI
jgi:hypothetical protein